MKNLNIERKLNWLPIEYEREAEIRASERYALKKMVESTEEEKYVLIGDWYYYLYAHDQFIDLCRTRGKTGGPSLTEVIRPEPYAISEDDVERAVHYWTCGSFEPGHYRISPLIERKLRILFE